MRTRLAIGMLATLLSFLLTRPDAFGFDDQVTHPQMTERAGRHSTGDSVLRGELGMPRGIDTDLRGVAGIVRPGIDWLATGARLEDHPTCRASNHFHDPLKPFTSSRVTDEPLIDVLCAAFAPIRSNVTWGTGYVSPMDRGPATGNPFAWDTARRAFAGALTGPSAVEREASLALTLETLGHVMHLVQDLAVPAHVRNDFRSHLANMRVSFSHPVEEAFERFVRVNPTLVDELVPVPLGLRDRPVTRFWDADRYGGANPSSDTEQGLAEYTNANFVSLNTMLSEDRYPFPRLSSTNAEALFGRDASVVRLVRAEDGRVDTGLYVDKIRDGETITNFLRAGYLAGDFIDRAAPGAPRTLVFQLDDETHRRHAEFLVPRALGYSAALLDYFFRGRLDVDLLDDGSGPRLAGTNASPEALADGTLAVYADRPDGLRRLAGGAVAVGRVEAGAQLPGVTVDPSDGAERFVAVYTGSLGHERAAAPDPGAVIGKVLGGHRVEEVFADATRWHLRTPRGIFPLPIPRSEIVELRWGDADNTLVGRTAFGTSGQPNRFRAYRLARPVGSVEVPLREAPDGGQEVDVQPTGEAEFPFGIDAGGLRLNSTIDYQQYLISFVRTLVVREGALVSDTYRDGKVERVVSQTASASFAWRLTLDRASLNNFRARPYLWQLRQIGLTADGRIVALVSIQLTQLDAGRPESFAVFPSRRFVWCGTTTTCSAPPEIQDGPPARAGYAFGAGASTHWALVDVSGGRIVHSTAADGVVIDNVIRHTRFSEPVVGGTPGGLAATEIRHHIIDDPGNASDFYPVDAQNNLRIGVTCNPGSDSGHYEVGRVDLTFGVPTASAAQYPAALASTAFAPFPEHLRSEQRSCLVSVGGISPSALVTVAQDEMRVYLNDAVGAIRVPDGSERMVFLFELRQGLATNFGGDYARIVSWDPPAGAASLRHELLTGDAWRLLTAAHDLAVVGGSNDPSITLVPLEGPRPVVSYPVPAAETENFRALGPALLYNVADLRFYRYHPALVRTALPASLAGGAAGAGDFHAIRLPP